MYLNSSSLSSPSADISVSVDRPFIKPSWDKTPSGLLGPGGWWTRLETADSILGKTGAFVRNLRNLALDFVRSFLPSFYFFFLNLSFFFSFSFLQVFSNFFASLILPGYLFKYYSIMIIAISIIVIRFINITYMRGRRWKWRKFKYILLRIDMR